MRPFRHIAILTLAVASFVAASAQDMQFSQAYSNPVHLNPAFAGTTGRTRAVFNYRNQWPALKHSFISHSVGTDHYLKATNGGIGINFHRDIAGSNRLSNTIVTAVYSQQIKLSRKATLAAGVKGGIGQRSFDGSKLLFADQVIRESSVSLSQQFLVPNHNYGDVSAGLLYFRKKWWLGASAHHLNRPNQSLMAGVSEIPTSFSVHGGGEIPVEAFKSTYGAKKLRVAFNYKSQGEWDQLDVGGFFTYYGLNLGMWYRGLPTKSYRPGYANHEAIVLLVGYEAAKHWSVGYSYDVTISRLAGHSGGAHEIALVYELDTQKAKQQKPRIVPCAKF